MIIRLTPTALLGAVLGSGGGGTGGSRSTFNAGTFSDIPTLNAWGASNLDSLFNNSNQVTIATIGTGIVYEWTGVDTPDTFPVGGDWTLRFQAGGDGIPPFESVAARDVFFSAPGNEALLKSGLPIEVNIDEGTTNTVANFVWTGDSNPSDYVSDDQRWQVAPFQVSNGTLMVGPGLRLSNAVGSVGIEMPDSQHALSLQMLYDQNGNTVPFFPALAAEETLDVNLLFDAQMPDPYELVYTTFGDNLTNDFIFRAATAGTVRVRYWLGPDDTGTLIFDERREITSGELADDILFGIGNEYLLPQGAQLFVRAEGVTLLGTLVDDPASPFDGENLLYFRSIIQPYTNTTLMTADDVDHPVTLRRDMPSAEDAAALAAASLNGNSALWSVANNQLGTSNRADATIQAQQPGQLDVDGNEIPTTPTAANTIQLRSGTTVRIFSANDYRVVTAPIMENDIREEVVFVFDDLTINNANLDTYNRKTLVCNLTGISKTITIAQNTDIDFFDVFVGESTPLLVATQGLERINDEVDKRFTANQGGRIKKMTSGGQYGIVYDSSNDLPSGNIAAEITRFTIDGIPTSVIEGTVLSGSQTFNYNVNHPEDVDGNLTLLQGGVELKTDVDPTLNTFDETITTVTVNDNDEVIFELRGETNESILISSFYRVRGHAPAEQLFFGLSNSNNPDTIDVSTMTSGQAGLDGSRIETGETTGGQRFILLVPTDHDPITITDTVLDQDVKDIFTRTPDVRTIGAVVYISYVLGPLTPGSSESYILGY